MQNPKIPVCIFRICLAPGAVRLTHGTYLINCMRRKHPSARDGKAAWQKQVVWFPAKEFGCDIFAPQAAVYSVTNKRPHSFHLGFSKFLKSHPSLTPQPEAAFRPGPMSSRSPRPLLQGPGPSRNQRTLLSLLTQLRPIEQNCHCGN